jgi:NAD-dependent deacetylase
MKSSKKVVVLSGAGMSAESGLGTFRDNGGLWERYAIDEVATHEAWEKDPEKVTEFYNMRRKQCFESSPNEGHKELVLLEKYFDVQIITQNIDDLHERAGSKNVMHLHGEINKVKSSGPNAEKAYFLQESWEVKIGEKCPDGYQLRPHVVWFGEAVLMMDEAIRIVEKADVFVVVGSSLNVYPAADLVNYVSNAAQKFLIDPKEVAVSNNFVIIQKSASEGLKELKEMLL